jgi:hypothetical protein
MSCKDECNEEDHNHNHNHNHNHKHKHDKENAFESSLVKLI